jgi:hypothetical protein
LPAFPRFIKVINDSEELESYLEKISNNLTDEQIVFKIADDFMGILVKENYKILNQNFVKKVVSYKVKIKQNSFNEELMHLRKQTAEDSILEIFLK